MKKSLISAIKKLLAKLGAEEVEGNNLVEVIDSGADAIEGGGSSGGGVLICTDTEGTLDKTMGEIQTAYVSGRSIIIYGGFYYSSVISVQPVREHEKTHNYNGVVQRGTNNDNTYEVTEATEEDALAAYPTLQ